MVLVSCTARALRDSTQRVVGGVAVTTTDVTERRRIDDERSLHAAVLTSINEGVCLVRASDLTVLYADGPLGQVFTNLLLDAAQAIGDGRAETNEIVVTSDTNAAGPAVVEFRDSGPGIRSDVLPRIFDPFYTTKPVGSGMGLGLAICHSIITASTPSSSRRTRLEAERSSA